MSPAVPALGAAGGSLGTGKPKWLHVPWYGALPGLLAKSLLELQRAELLPKNESKGLCR